MVESRDSEFYATLVELERSIIKSDLKPEIPETVRYCASYIMLQAIARAKSPTPDKKMIKEMFHLARDILALGGTEVTENQRLLDVINAMIDADDIPNTIRKSSEAVSTRISLFESRIVSDLDIMKEDHVQIQKTITEIRKGQEEIQTPRSAYKMILVTLASAGIVICSIILCLLLVGIFMVKVAQDERENRADMKQPSRYEQRYSP